MCTLCSLHGVTVSLFPPLQTIQSPTPDDFSQYFAMQPLSQLKRLHAVPCPLPTQYIASTELL